MAKPRIRSIKPEFWTDPKIADLPKPTALFFISLWNLASDQGVVEADSRAISLRVPIFRSQDVEKMLNALWQAGLIARSKGDGEGLAGGRAGVGLVYIRGWHHQKIDKPTVGKWNPHEIQWVAHDGSTITLEPSSTGKDGKGKDRKGREGSGGASANPPTASDVEAEEAKAWAARQDLTEYYRDQLQKRRKIKPIILEEDEVALAQLYGDPEIAPQLRTLINRYVNMDDQWFRKQGWNLRTLKTDIHKVNGGSAA